MYNLFVTGVFALIGGVYWFIIQEKFLKNQELKNEHKHTVLLKIKKEFNLIKDDIEAYKKKPLQKYKDDPKYEHWYYPDLIITKFDNSQLLLLLNEGDSNFLEGDTVLKISDLMLEIANYQHLQDDMNEYALKNRTLGIEVKQKLNKSRSGEKVFFDQQQKEYMNKIFEFNYRLHVEMMGDINNKQSLYSKFSRAHKALVKELNKSIDLYVPIQFVMASGFAWLWMLGGLYFIYLHFLG